MTELQTALRELAERGSPAGASAVTQRALDAAMLPVRRARRRWPVVLLTSAAAAVVLALAASSLYVREKTADVDRVNLTGVLATPAAARTTLNILVVGLDSRLGYDGVRGDSIAVVRVSRARGVIGVLSIPRDLYAGGDRINVAASDPGRLVRLVAQETGVRIDHYAELDNVGLRRLVDTLGGITMPVAAPVRDRFSGLELPAGCVHLDGEQAVAWDRSRHLESFENGRWHVDPTGDIGRIQRQQQLALLALDKLAAARGPRTLTRLLDVAADNLRVDDAFPFGRLRTWAKASVPRQGIAMLTLPTTPASLPNGAAVLQLDRDQLPEVVRVFNHPPQPSTTRGPRPACS